jgi:rhamnosyltransferase
MENLEPPRQGNTCAVVVTYNPDLPSLRTNLEALSHEVERIFLFDNDSVNESEVASLVLSFPSVVYEANSDNFGLPLNYNKALSKAAEEGFTWLVFLDQDSLVPPHYIEKMGVAFALCPPGTVSLTPNIHYATTPGYNHAPTPTLVKVDNCISSGNLVSVEAALRVSGFDPRYFIDYVDFEFDDKLIKAGYSIIRVDDLLLEHDLGDSRLFKYWGKKVLVFSKSPLRLYYQTRNKYYFLWTHKTGWAYAHSLLAYRFQDRANLKAQPKKLRKTWLKVYRQARHDAKRVVMGPCPHRWISHLHWGDSIS